MPPAVQCVRRRCLRLYGDRDESPPLCRHPGSRLPIATVLADASRYQPGPRSWRRTRSRPAATAARSGGPADLFGQGTGTGLPPHPDSVPAPAVSRPAPWPVSKPGLMLDGRQPGSLLLRPGPAAGARLPSPGVGPAPAVLVLCVYEERARLAPTTFVGFFWRILRRLVPAAGEGPFPQVDEEQPGRRPSRGGVTSCRGGRGVRRGG